MFQRTMTGMAALLFFAAPLAAQQAEGQAEGQVAAEAFAREPGLREGVLQLRMPAGEIRQHAQLLRALPGENKTEFLHENTRSSFYAELFYSELL